MKTWFLSLQETGEYIGIRFGRIPPGRKEPEWVFLEHTAVDGIGGFAKILRDRGAHLERLPQIKHPSPASRLALLKNLPKFIKPRQRLKWRGLQGPAASGNNQTSPPAVAWHVFDVTTTTHIRRVCRKAGVTVNSFLLKHLAKAIRPYLQDQSAIIPWMIPVNMRGKINRPSDMDNHTSYVPIGVRSYDTAHDVHLRIYERLQHGDHWANWYSYESSRLLNASARRYLIKIEKCTAEWNIGSFSNLGDWDTDCEIDQPALAGSWIFAPPVLRCQHIGAGCVTFQNRLALTIQAHPELTINPADARAWLDNWTKEIDIDIASFLGQPATNV